MGRMMWKIGHLEGLCSLSCSAPRNQHVLGNELQRLSEEKIPLFLLSSLTAIAVPGIRAVRGDDAWWSCWAGDAWSPFSVDAWKYRELSEATRFMMLPVPLGSRAGLSPQHLRRGPAMVLVVLVQGHKEWLKIDVSTQQTRCLISSGRFPR